MFIPRVNRYKNTEFKECPCSASKNLDYAWRSNVGKLSGFLDIIYQNRLQGNSSEGPSVILLHVYHLHVKIESNLSDFFCFYAPSRLKPGVAVAPCSKDFERLRILFLHLTKFVRKSNLVFFWLGRNSGCVLCHWFAHFVAKSETMAAKLNSFIFKIHGDLNHVCFSAPLNLLHGGELEVFPQYLWKNTGRQLLPRLI